MTAPLHSASSTDSPAGIGCVMRFVVLLRFFGDDGKQYRLQPGGRLAAAILPLVSGGTWTAKRGNDLGGGVVGKVGGEAHGEILHRKNNSAMRIIVLAIVHNADILCACPTPTNATVSTFRKQSPIAILANGSANTKKQKKPTMQQKKNSVTMSVESERFPRGATVNVEFADGSREIGGVLEWDDSGYYKVTIPAEGICRWAPADAVSLFLHNSICSYAQNTTKPSNHNESQDNMES